MGRPKVAAKELLGEDQSGRAAALVCCHVIPCAPLAPFVGLLGWGPLSGHTHDRSELAGVGAQVLLPPEFLGRSFCARSGRLSRRPRAFERRPCAPPYALPAAAAFVVRLGVYSGAAAAVASASVRELHQSWDALLGWTATNQEGWSGERGARRIPTRFTGVSMLSPCDALAQKLVLRPGQVPALWSRTCALVDVTVRTRMEGRVGRAGPWPFWRWGLDRHPMEVELVHSCVGSHPCQRRLACMHIYPSGLAGVSRGTRARARCHCGGGSGGLGSGVWR